METQLNGTRSDQSMSLYKIVVTVQKAVNQLLTIIEENGLTLHVPTHTLKAILAIVSILY